MENKHESSFIDLYNFLEKPVYIHKVKKGELNCQVDQFLSIGSNISTQSIQTIITCLVEKGVRKFLKENLAEADYENIEKLVENWIEQETNYLEKKISNTFSQTKKGNDFTLSNKLTRKEDDSTGLLDNGFIYTDIASLKGDVFNIFQNHLHTARIKKEGKILSLLSENLDFKRFVENPNPGLFHEIFHFLLKKKYLISEYEDFSNLFSGKKPKNIVIFKSALLLSQIKYLLIDLGFRSSSTFSLETQFANHIKFLENKEIGDVAQQIRNSAKNISKHSKKRLKKEFTDYQAID